MKGHHLILGELEDFITGEILEDTLDERYRQKIARMLVNEKGYAKHEIIPRKRINAEAGERKGSVTLDFRVQINGRTGMIIRFGPGSLITRHRPVLAMSRLAESYQIPVAVVTNGEDADVLDGKTGEITGSGFDAIPDRASLGKIMVSSDFEPLSPKRTEMESRVVYCYEVDGSCPCDTDICRL
ncbi:MAG: type I restriction enzyme HsdR N-terminal domain-containing protein [Desulfococcaceae bacterium]